VGFEFRVVFYVDDVVVVICGILGCFYYCFVFLGFDDVVDGFEIVEVLVLCVLFDVVVYGVILMSVLIRLLILFGVV